MVHPDTQLRFINHDIGFGVVATKLIPQGTITWVLDELDQLLAPERVERLSDVFDPFIEKYAYNDSRGNYILCWDHARFINHSCEATCLSPGYNFEVAVRDIHPGEQLTDDYGTLNLREPFRCLCGSRHCRGTIGPGDFEAHSARWDRLVHDAFPAIKRVAQPLWSLVREKEVVEAVLAGKTTPASIRTHYHAKQNGFVRA